MPDVHAAAATLIDVTVAASPAPRVVFEAALRLPAGANVQDAVDASGLARSHPDVDWTALPAGIWSHAATRQTVLHDGDRVELYRPLLVDPKEARRARFQTQGVRSTGLFARRRSGGKQGY